ncbi:hypothetical protein WJX81_005939 [Elliptochloris bilobata]|uniref:Uncharacterized protein n=1 Tax=Elliptochloris bilobata TaxID=381761 RepID=A0AAW1QMX7_9CHLO
MAGGGDGTSGDQRQPLLDTADAPPKRRSTLLTVCPFILGNEFCERLAYYGLSTNLIIYMTRVMRYSPAFASAQLTLFEGTAYLTPILGAWLADAAWGRYKTILVFSIIYMVGLVVLCASAWLPGWTPRPDDDSAKWFQSGALFAALYIVALGTGGIKPNVSAFGADQLDVTDPQDRKDKNSFFNWFYLAINLGSLLAVTVVVYVQDSISWAIGFAIPAVAMAVAIVVFVSGSSLYTHVEPTESPMTRVVKVLWAAGKGSRRKALKLRRQREREARARSGYSGPVNLPPGMDSAPGIAAAMARSHSYDWVLAAAELPETDEEQGGGVAGFSAEQVEEVRMVVRMLPVFLTTILYWTIYAQMGSFFVVQGAQMDRWLFGGRFKVPAASLALFNTLSIILLIPIYDRGLVPLLRHYGTKLSLLSRIGWGLLVCAVAMAVSAALEAWRLSLFRRGVVLQDDPDAVDLNVFWQVPQYLLIGLSEVLAAIGQLEFFYDQAPDVMRSCSMALQLLSVCIGSYLSGALVLGVSQGSAALGAAGGAGWLPEDLNEGRLDLFFLLLAGLSLVNLALFVWVAVNYRYKSPMRIPSATGPQRADVTIGGVPFTPEEDVGVYGRSVTFAPDSPMLPAPFR